MLKSLDAQTCRPDQVFIVDGGTIDITGVGEKFSGLDIILLRCRPPSSAKQRNLGTAHVKSGFGFVGFLDDDVVLMPDALKAMSDFWKKADPDIAGASMNMANHPRLAASLLKKSKLFDRLGVYARKSGAVSPSGFQTMIGRLDADAFLEWLPSGAVIWRKEVFEEFRFDEWFQGYSYLEDLDFSYRVGRKFRLAAVADAVYYHLPAGAGRESSFLFGNREVVNRVYFVKKNRELSVGKCYLTLAMRMAMTLVSFFRSGEISSLKRLFGNLIGLASSFLFSGSAKES
jgi:GT2 family glycosyltransferase